MKNRLIVSSIALVSLLIGGAAFFAAPEPVNAQLNLCTYIKPICDALGIDTNNPSETAGENVSRFVSQRAQLLLSLLFIGIVLIAVYIIITNGVKYIQSQGDEGKIKEATKAIKTVFIGIAVLFIGIAGLVLVLVALNATNILNQQDPNGNQCRVDPLTGIICCPNDPNPDPVCSNVRGG